MAKPAFFRVLLKLLESSEVTGEFAEYGNAVEHETAMAKATAISPARALMLVFSVTDYKLLLSRYCLI